MVIRSHNSKDRQHNDPKGKTMNNGRQNTTQKTRPTRTSLRMNSDAPEGLAVPALLVTNVVWNDTEAKFHSQWPQCSDGTCYLYKDRLLTFAHCLLTF